MSRWAVSATSSPASRARVTLRNWMALPFTLGSIKSSASVDRDVVDPRAAGDARAADQLFGLAVRRACRLGVGADHGVGATRVAREDVRAYVGPGQLCAHRDDAARRGPRDGAQLGAEPV